VFIKEKKMLYTLKRCFLFYLLTAFRFFPDTLYNNLNCIHTVYIILYTFFIRIMVIECVLLFPIFFLKLLIDITIERRR